jgi:hypothetical protein
VPPLFSRSLCVASLLTIVSVAGCSTSSKSVPPVTPPLGNTPLAQDRAAGARTVPVPLMLPDGNSSKLTENVNPAGGKFIVPKFGGFSGAVGYPSNNAFPGTTVTLISSTTNINHAPQPPTGTVVFYLQAKLSSPIGYVTFNNGTATARLHSASLLSSKTYSIYAYALGKPLHGTPYPVGSPTHGTLTFTSPIQGGTVPAGITVTVELDQN